MNRLNTLNKSVCKFSSLQVQDNNDTLAYWLSNTSTLLLLLQHTLKASGAASLTPQRRRTSSASLFGRMSQVRGSFNILLDHIVSFPYFSPHFFIFTLNLRVYGPLHKVRDSHFLMVEEDLVGWMTYGKLRPNILHYCLSSS